MLCQRHHWSRGVCFLIKINTAEPSVRFLSRPTVFGRFPANIVLTWGKRPESWCIRPVFAAYNGRMETTPKRPPKEVGARGRALWREVVAQYTLTPTEYEVLREICCATDEVGRLTTVAKHVSATVKGSRGQQITHPIFAELRAHRESIRRLTRQLNLPDARSGQRTRKINRQPSVVVSRLRGV